MDTNTPGNSSTDGDRTDPSSTPVRSACPDGQRYDGKAAGFCLRYWSAACVLVLCWTVGLAWWTRCGPGYPKMDAIGWVTAGTMLREGEAASSFYAIRKKTVTIEVDRAPGRFFGGPRELTLTSVLPGAALARRAARLGYTGTDPPAFVYSPGAALLGVPLSWLGWPGATVVTDVLNLLAFGSVIALVVTRLRGIAWDSLVWLAGLLVLFALSHPMRFSLFLGQITPLVTLGWIVLWLPDNRRGAIVSGVIVGLLGVLKVFPMLLVLWFLVRRRWLAPAIAVAIFASGCVALGTGALTAWVAAAREMAAPVRVWTENQSLSALMHRFVYPLGLVRDWVIVRPAPLQFLSTCAGLVLLLFWVWRALKQMGTVADQLHLFGCLWILPMSLTSLFWSHYIVLVFPVLAVALVDRNRGAASRCAAAFAGLLLVVSGDRWTRLMPALESALGSEVAALSMRCLIGLPAAAMMLLFFVMTIRRTRAWCPA